MEFFGKFFKHVSYYAAVAFVLLAGTMFISCDLPSDDNAQKPSIIEQPVGGFWNVFLEDSTFKLTVSANITDGGELTYQWYSNTSNSTSGSIAIGEKSEEPELVLNMEDYEENGSYYFYVIVTNTNNSVSGTKTATTTSDVAVVAVAGYPDKAYTTSAMPENLKGTWISEYGEIFIINDNTFTSKYGYDVTYAGTFVTNGHRSNNDGDGYITIRYTENSGFVDSENKFYVIHYKELSKNEVTLAGGSLNADPDFTYGVGPGGKTSQEEAEAVMTVSAGYFEWYSILSREDETSFQFPAEWIGEWFPDNKMDLFLFTAPNVLANYFSNWGSDDPDYIDGEDEEWVYFYEIEILDMAQDGDEMVLYGKFGKLGEFFTTSGSGEYSALYINKVSEGEMEILLIAENFSTPMYETLAAAKAALPFNSNFRSKYIDESVALSYTKNE
ncbi:MAG: hypothetical protein FWB86_11645 [Treponema sp.]|nr:hypothetical protein [Treponema sp.]MCL2252157.1 hypothetical protein [Treponema sp.]